MKRETFWPPWGLVACMAFIWLLSGCAVYKHSEKGTLGFSFLKKGDFASLEMSKDGLKIKDAKTGGDVEMLKALAEGAVQGAVKGAKP